MSGLLAYSSNNSGGSWWLRDADWKALEDAGWIVHWYHDASEKHYETDPDDKDDPHNWKNTFGSHSHQYGDKKVQLTPANRTSDDFLGAMAKSAAKRFDNMYEGVDEWESITGQSASAEGCNCCGNPHSFTWEDDDGTSKHSSVYVSETRMEWW